jgi:hypothetical protein
MTSARHPSSNSSAIAVEADGRKESGGSTLGDLFDLKTRGRWILDLDLNHVLYFDPFRKCSHFDSWILKLQHLENLSSFSLERLEIVLSEALTLCIHRSDLSKIPDQISA